MNPFRTSTAHPLLGVDGNDRQALTKKGVALRVDVFQLRIAVRVLGAFHWLGVALQAIAHLVQQTGNFAVSNAMAFPLQFHGQAPRTLTDPAQGRFGVPAGGRFHQCVERLQDAGLSLGKRFAVAALLAAPPSRGSSSLLPVPNSPMPR